MADFFFCLFQAKIPCLIFLDWPSFRCCCFFFYCLISFPSSSPPSSICTSENKTNAQLGGSKRVNKQTNTNSQRTHDSTRGSGHVPNTHTPAPINNWSVLLGRLFDELCFFCTFKSRNHCSHFHIKIPPPGGWLWCGRLAAWLMSPTSIVNARVCACSQTRTRTLSYPALQLQQPPCKLVPGSAPSRHWGKPRVQLGVKHANLNLRLLFSYKVSLFF